MSDTKKDEWLDEPVTLGIILGMQRDDASDIAYWQNIHELRKAPDVCLQNRFFSLLLNLFTLELTILHG